MSSERQLLARAQELQDVSDLAGMVTCILGGARLARLDQMALGGLVGAALVLGAGQVRVFMAGARGIDQEITSERAFAQLVVGVEDDIADRLKEAERLEHLARVARARARRDLAALQRYLASLPAEQQPGDGELQLRRCVDRIICADLAVRVFGPLIRQLKFALQRIGSVPEDLGETYESVYRLIRRGGQMPHDGDWITGQDRAS